MTALLLSSRECPGHSAVAQPINEDIIGQCSRCCGHRCTYGHIHNMVLVIDKLLLSRKSISKHHSGSERAGCSTQSQPPGHVVIVYKSVPRCKNTVSSRCWPHMCKQQTRLPEGSWKQPPNEVNINMQAESQRGVSKLTSALYFLH